MGINDPHQDAIETGRPNGRAKPSLTVRLMLRGLLVTVGVLAGLGLWEITLRIVGAGPALNPIYAEHFRLSDNPVLGYELVPGASDRQHTISSAGLRDREFAIPKPPGVFRIVVLGDSVTFGYGCFREQTYPKRLEALLNESAGAGSVAFEVLNLGVTGYNAPQIVEFLRVRGLSFEPDLITYGYVLNDPQSFSLEAEALRRLQERLEDSWTDALSRRAAWWLRYSRLYLLAYERFVLERHPPVEVPEDPAYAAVRMGDPFAYLRSLQEDADSWRRVQTAFADLAALTAPLDLPLLVAVFPVDCGNCRVGYPLDDVHQQVRAEAEVNGFSVVDLTASFYPSDGGNSLFRDFLHPNAEGHQAAAEAILAWLCDRGLLPPPGCGAKFSTVAPED